MKTEEMARIYYHLKNKKPKDYVKEGQEVYLIPANNRARYGNPKEKDYFKKRIVEKVANKYFYLKDSDLKFCSECGYIRNKSNMSSDYYIILSKRDLIEAKMRFQKLTFFQKCGIVNNLIRSMSLEDLSKIEEVLKKYYKEEK